MSLPGEDRRVIGTDLSTVQFGWPIGVVWGFVKKPRKTPDDDLDLARRRMKEMKA